MYIANLKKKRRKIEMLPWQLTEIKVLPKLLKHKLK